MVGGVDGVADALSCPRSFVVEAAEAEIGDHEGGEEDGHVDGSIAISFDGFRVGRVIRVCGCGGGGVEWIVMVVVYADGVEASMRIHIEI